MYTHYKVIALTAILASSPMVFAESEKDCLLKGTVQHGAQDTTVKINSVSQYDEESRCRLRRNQKMEFKLPQDTRVKEAPSGSEVQYRYQVDENGESNAELISVGA